MDQHGGYSFFGGGVWTGGKKIGCLVLGTELEMSCGECFTVHYMPRPAFCWRERQIEIKTLVKWRNPFLISTTKNN